MTFPLGSLRSNGGASNPLAAAVATSASTARKRSRAGTPAPLEQPVGWRPQLMLLVGGVVWLLAVIALASHNPADAAFSTSGSSAQAINKAGAVGAWFSDLTYVTFGYSVWWAIAVTLRAWLGALARLLRHDDTAPMSTSAPGLVWRFWCGLALLLAASSSLE